MKKLLVLTALVLFAWSIVWAAPQAGNTNQKADQTTKVDQTKKASPQGTPLQTAHKLPAKNAKASTTETAPAPAPLVIGNKDADQQAEKEAGANAPTIQQLRDEKTKSEAVIEVLQQKAVEAPKYQPRYGVKGELLNPEPVVYPMGMNPSNPQGEIPIITSTLLSQTFHGTGWSLDNQAPLGGWIVADSGTEGSQTWYTDDWHKFYYAATGWNDTVLADELDCQCLYRNRYVAIG